MLNKVQLIGRLGKDPEVNTLESGARLAKFSVATSEKYKDKQGQSQEATEWHNIVIWDKLVDIVEKYLNKGDLVYLEGKIKTRQYEVEGQTRYATEITAYEMKMLGSKTETRTDTEIAAAAPTKPEENISGETDQLPF
jgi:single-strand DNA-binding protein